MTEVERENACARPGRLQNRWQRMSLFWKAYLLIAGLLTLVVALAEFTIEPSLEVMLEGMYGGFQPWHEAVIWVAVILTSSLLCGYILSKILTHKLDRMARVSSALARGNLSARLPAQGNNKDAFDILARGFNEMAGAIEDQLRHERRLLADISHELRSPLTRMTIAVELLERRRGEDERATLLARLAREVDNMKDLVSTLLVKARESFNAKEDFGEVDISGLLRELVDDAAFLGEARQKNVRAEIADGLAVYGHVDLLQRLFGNILSNAVFYTPDNGEVLVRARLCAEKVLVTIRDFGPGVPENQLEDIFRAFYRVDGSRSRVSGGAGLGLAIAREAAVRHGGEIAARNIAPGLEMTVALPANGRPGRE